MALYKEQMHPETGWQTNSGKGRRWAKKQRNKFIRRQAKDITNEHPKINRVYKGWAD
jgi:hypothetical protein